MIINQHGLDTRVYKEVYPGACRFCLNLYTTAGAGSKPRIFKLSELIQNGDNIGRKSKDWKPVVGPVHPFCRCSTRYIPDNYVWDDKLQTFVPPKDYKSKVERKSKVTIIVGDKKFLV